jgi:hypothetical protein
MSNPMSKVQCFEVGGFINFQTSTYWILDIGHWTLDLCPLNILGKPFNFIGGWADWY